MELENRDIVIGLLLIGVVALTGWVGFLYVTPITKTETETDEENVLIPYYIYVEEEIDTRDEIPLNWEDAPLNAYLSIYNETGEEIKVYLSDILDGIELYWEQEDDPQGRKLHDHKDEYMGVNSIVDNITGITFTGVYLLDILEFAGVYYAWNISCKSNQQKVINPYFNTTTSDILYKASKTGKYKYTIVAIAANGRWLQESGFGNFSLLQADSVSSVYDLKEVRTITEWNVNIYINGTLQDFAINRTNVIDPYNPNGWTYSYHKMIQDFGGKYNFNRTYWGLNVSYILNQTADRPGYNYTMRVYAIDGYSTALYNNTDVDNGLTYPTKYGKINSTVPIPGGVPLPQTDLLMTLTYKQWRHAEYGLYATDPVWDKAYMNGYSGGPFKLVIPGQTSNKYFGMIYRIDVTTYSGTIP